MLSCVLATLRFAASIFRTLLWEGRPGHIAVAVVMLLAAGSAFADAEVRAGKDWIRITARPCSDEKVLQHIPEAERLDYRAASAEFQGVGYSACWKPVYQRESVMLRYEDGDAGLVPFQHLKPVQEI